MDDLISRRAAIEAMTADNLSWNLDSVHDDDLKRAARAAQRALARLPAAQRWIPVTERLPREKHPVQVCYVGYNTGKVRSDMVACRHDRMWCYWEGEPMEVCKVQITHWRELPEPPKEE